MASSILLPIIDIRDETYDTYTIILENKEPTLLTYFPGQYITVIVPIDGKEERRAYSLSSSPEQENHLGITIKRTLKGKVSNYLRDYLKVGDRLEILPPDGNFYVQPEAINCKHYILIAAGSGITPLISILISVLIAEPLSKVSLFYGSRNESAIIFKKRLEDLKKSYKDRLDIHLTLSQPSANWKGAKGRLNEQRIYDLILDLFMIDEFSKSYFICGPEQMMIEAENALLKHAIHPANIFKEYFSTPIHLKNTDQKNAINPESNTELNSTKSKPPFHQPNDYHMTFIQKGHSQKKIMVKAGQDILAAVREHQIDLPFSCLGGICGTCKVKRKAGKIEQLIDIGLTDQEKEEDWVLACQSYPLENDVVIEQDKLV